MAITAEGLKLGHKYVMGNGNAKCAKCSDAYSEQMGRPIVALDCDYDEDDDEENV